MHSPIMENGTLPGMQNDDDDGDEDDDDDNIENLSNRNNLSGSYSNLFRSDKLDDDDLIMNNKELMKHGLDMTMNDEMHRENVYSNIPRLANSVSSASGLQQVGDSLTSDKSDMHVYSNISSPTNQLPPPLLSPTAIKVTRTKEALVTSTSQTKLNDSSFGGGNSIGGGPLIAQMISDDSFDANSTSGGIGMSVVGGSSTGGGIGSSSTLLADDLDLDDPVQAAGTFGQTPKKQSTKLTNDKKSKSIDGASSSVGIGTTNTTGKLSKSISMEMKNVIPQVGIIDSQATISGVSGSSNQMAINNNSNNSLNNSSTSNAFCSPSRMRLLHDTTMIDTALDLDSLDGSSLGNNSQACLVKTAIV